MLRAEPEKVPCMQRRHSFSLDAQSLGGANLRLNPSRDGGRDFVLQLEKVLEIAVVAFRPQLPSALGLHQLSCNAHALPDLAEAALNQVLGPERQTDPAHVAASSLEGEARIACNHREGAVLGQGGDDVFGDSVRAVFLSGSPLRFLNGSTATDGFPPQLGTG